MVVVLAAHDNTAHSHKWVAQCLALVCRDFQAAVEPALIETVRVTTRNYTSIVAQKHRFAHTKRLILDDHKFLPRLLVPEPDLFEALVSFGGRHEKLWHFARFHGFKPRTVVLHGMYRYAVQLEALQRLRTVTHLHIQSFCTTDPLVDVLPPSITHLVVDPNSHGRGDVACISMVSSVLRSHLKLQRLLVRTVHLHPIHTASLVSALRAIAKREPDDRLWVDDSISYGHDCSGAQAQLEAEEANGHDTIWFTGRRPYSTAESC